MKLLIVSVTCMLFSLNSCLTIEFNNRPRFDDDGYSKIKGQKDIDLSQNAQSLEIDSFSTDSFYEVSLEMLKDYLSKNKKSILVLYAPWCPHSNNLAYFTDLLDSADFKNAKFLSINYDLKGMTLTGENIHRKDTRYVISRNVSGKESSKIKMTILGLDPSYDTLKLSYIVPQLFFFSGQSVVRQIIGEPGRSNLTYVRDFIRK